TAQGKGFDRDSARVSALMEAIECWHGEQIDKPTRCDTWQALREAGQEAVLDRLPLFAGGSLPPEPPTPRVEGYGRGARTPSWVPFARVTMDFVFPPDYRPTFFPSSNGLSSGNHFLEAVLHGLCEVIERDAEALWRESDDLRPVDLATVTDS